MGEIILAVPESVVQKIGIPQGVSTLPAEEIASIIKQLSGSVHALDRDTLEGNPTYRQLIPYISVHLDDKIFSAIRTKAGGDPRLHGKRIIGFGGHANPVEEGMNKSLSVVLRENAVRELDEELILSENLSLTFKGFINDYSIAVNRDHLGIYMQAHIASAEVKETSVLVDAVFVSLDEVAAMQGVPLESWSEMVLGALKNEQQQM